MTSCSDADREDVNDIINSKSYPCLQGMRFSVEDNNLHLIETIKAEIIGDSVVECRIPYLVRDKNLIASFDYQGDSLFIDDMPVVNGVTTIDYSKPRKIMITQGSLTRSYTIYVYSFTGLPVLYIDTKDRSEIQSKEEYVDAYLKLQEDVVTRAPGSIVESEIQIKGRGNSTWRWPKKPYTIKLKKKQALLGEAPDKSWVLLANYCDKTMLRNALAFYMGKQSILDYTPKSHFVELILNNEYQGTYELCEKIKISENRVNIGKNGFLLEIDAKPGPNDVIFTTKHLNAPVNVKDPDITTDDTLYNYVRDFVQKAEETLFSDHFMDAKEGWRKYFDEESFVDWYLINEISKDYDKMLYTSCFMTLQEPGILKMGPLWDFDTAFGNMNFINHGTIDGLWIKENASWYKRLFEDPGFVEKVKSRFNHFYNHESNCFDYINDYSHYLKYSVTENDNKWHTLYNWTEPNFDVLGSYNNEVQYLKHWLSQRLEWMKAEFSEM